MSYHNFNHAGNPYAGHDDNNDSIEQMPQNPFDYPPYISQRRSISPESDKGDSSDTLRQYSETGSSRPESYVFPQVPLTARNPNGLLGRPSGHRTLSDLYDESPPRTPTSSQPPRRPWLSASRPESEATLMGHSPTPYSSSPSPYVRVQSLHFPCTYTDNQTAKHRCF
jgi:hypothetical protein